MTLRTIANLGTADWTPEEDVLAGRLIADGRTDEVAFLHRLKVAFDMQPTLDESWAAEIAAATPTQEALL